MLRISANSLTTHTLYTLDFSFIFFILDFVFFLICAGDVAACEASDRVNKTRPLIFS